MEIQTLIQFLGNFPIAIVFVYLYWQTKKELSDKINSKDEYIATMTDRLINLVENNTVAVSNVKSAVEANTKSTEALATQINTIFIYKKPRKNA